MKKRSQERLYALVALFILTAVLALAYALRNTQFTVFPHQVEKVRPGGVLPHKR